MKVNILGTNYEIIEQNENENLKISEAYGLLEKHSKKIVLDSDILNEKDIMKSERIELFKNKVLRHEIIHAFLVESGLDTNCDWHKEEMVDWFAWQMPKLINVLEELGICDR